MIGGVSRMTNSDARQKLQRLFTSSLAPFFTSSSPLSETRVLTITGETMTCAALGAKLISSLSRCYLLSSSSTFAPPPHDPPAKPCPELFPSCHENLHASAPVPSCHLVPGRALPGRMIAR